jgi:hypothetical protein
LNFNSSGAFPAGSNLTINQGATVNFANLGTAQNILVDQIGVGGTLGLNNNNLNISGSAIYSGSGTAAATGTISTTGGVGSITGTGSIVAPGALVFYLGNGSLTLSNTGTNNWAATNVASGTLNLSSASELPPNQNILIGSNATLTYQNPTAGTITAPLVNVGGTLNLNNNNLNVSGGVIFGSGSGSITGTGSIAGAGNGLTFNLSGGNTLTLSNTGTDTYGATTVLGGTLNINANASGGTPLPSGQNLNIGSGAQLALLNGTSPYLVTVNAFNDPGNLSLGNNALIIQSGVVTSTGTGGSITGAGAIQGSGGLVFNASIGSFQIADTGPNTWGSTNVSAGTITLSSAGALPVNQNLTVAAGASLVAGNITGVTQSLQINTLTANGLVSLGNNVIAIANGSVGATGSITGTSSSVLTVTGPGTTTFSDTANNSFGTANVTGGTLVLSTVNAWPAGANLNISPGASVVASSGGSAHLLQVSAFYDGGLLDLNNNDLLVHAGSTPQNNLAAISTLIAAGSNWGAGMGTSGIVSSYDANSTTHLTALGVIQNNQSGTALFTSANKFEGATPGAGDILVKNTYYGDCTLAGQVTSTDYTLIDAAFLNNQNASAPALTGWYNGDFNYDGVINGSDYTLIDNAFNSQGAAISAQVASLDAIATAQIAPAVGATSVPEPSVLGLLGIGAVSLLSRRRRFR